MNKDVIYIDVDDDVTAIIGKIKKSKEKIVALVPPKRSGTLQSAVNVRLLDRMARAEKKQLVLITSNPALVALAASASIPVAKNLQSKPEIAEPREVIDEDEEEIIDGAALPVGEHAKTAEGDEEPAKDSRGDVIESLDIDLDDEAIDGKESSTGTGAMAAASAKTTSKPGGKANKPKIPNFDSFRKKLFFGITGGVLLAALLVWMFVFAPAATVVITASTSPSPVSATVKLGGTAATDYKAGIVRSVSQQEKKDESVEFTATGQKDMGEKAKGVVRLVSASATIPKGTQLTAAGKAYLTDETVYLTIDDTSTDVGVTAVAAGAEYNGTTGTMSGAPAGVTAVIVTAPSGGTTHIATVVSADDIERAKGQLIGKTTDEEKKVLTEKFKDGEKVIDSSFTVDRGEAVSAPAVDQEVSEGAKPKLTIPTTYTLYAVPGTDVDTYLKGYLESQLGSNTSQKIYSTGLDKAAFSNFRKDGDTLTAVLTATGSIGPNIDEDAIKQQVKGKIYGEAQSTLQATNGIKAVDVKFSWFWVRTIPNDTNKIHIEFKVKNE